MPVGIQYLRLGVNDGTTVCVKCAGADDDGKERPVGIEWINSGVGVSRFPLRIGTRFRVHLCMPNSVVGIFATLEFCVDTLFGVGVVLCDLLTDVLHEVGGQLLASNPGLQGI